MAKEPETAAGFLTDYFSELMNRHRDLLMELDDLQHEMNMVSLAIARLEDAEA